MAPPPAARHTLLRRCCGGCRWRAPASACRRGRQRQHDTKYGARAPCSGEAAPARKRRSRIHATGRAPSIAPGTAAGVQAPRRARGSTVCAKERKKDTAHAQPVYSAASGPRQLVAVVGCKQAGACRPSRLQAPLAARKWRSVFGWCGANGSRDVATGSAPHQGTCWCAGMKLRPLGARTRRTAPCPSIAARAVTLPPSIAETMV